MKKIIFASALILTSVLGATAQKNTILLYGDLGFQSDKTATDPAFTTSTIVFRPGVGYQFNDNWTVGINLGVESSKQEVNGGDNKVNTFEAGPFLRYTQPLSDIFRVFGQLDLGFRASKNDPVGDNNEVKSTGFVGRVFPAIAVNVKNNLCLNFGFGGLGFETNKVEDADNSSSSFFLTFGSQFNIGISKNF